MPDQLNFWDLIKADDTGDIFLFHSRKASDDKKRMREHLCGFGHLKENTGIWVCTMCRQPAPQAIQDLVLLVNTPVRSVPTTFIDEESND